MINNNGIVLTASSQVKRLVSSGTNQISLLSEVVATGSLAALTIDAAADINISGFYFV